MFKRFFALVTLLGFLATPLTASAVSYVIQRGDTLTSIAQGFNLTIEEIATQNNIANPDRIYAGETLDLNGDAAVLGGPGGTYTPVTAYQSRLSQYISATASTIPVASTKDKSGNQISLSDISSSSTVRVYLSVDTGLSKEEIIACTGLTVSSWTNCTRGLAFQGGSTTASTTLAFAHNAGASIIITDVGQFFNEFVSVSGNQTIYDLKTFNLFPRATSTTAIPTNGSELATKYYVDQVGAGGFTCSNVSSTLGLQCLGTVPEKVGIYASSTLAFDSLGRIYVVPTFTLPFTSAGIATFSSTSTFNGPVVLNATSTYEKTTPFLNPKELTNKLYQDLQSTSATGTTGHAITAGQALYFSTTSTLAKTDSNVATSTFYFVGFAEETVASGAVVRFTKPGGTNCSQSGLTPGLSYFLNGASGQISSSAGTNFAKVGLAVSATCIQVSPPKYISRGSYTSSGSATRVIYTGFYPAHVEFRAVGGTSLQGIMSIGDDSNKAVIVGPGAVSQTDTRAYSIISGGTSFKATYSLPTQFGFTLTETQVGGGTDIAVQYTAYSE